MFLNNKPYSKSIGEWKEAKLNGECLKETYYPKDKIEFGTWKDGKLVDPKEITPEEKEAFITKC